MRTVIGLLVVFLISSIASAAILTVDCLGGGEFATIQEAVDAAAAGDTLLVSPCVYYECVDASGKGLSFIGAGSSVTRIECSSSEPALRIAEEDTKATSVAGITLDSAASGPAVRWSSRLRLDSCEVSGRLDGAGGLSSWHHVSIVANGCSLGDVSLTGGGTSHMTECDMADLRVVGYFQYEYSGPQTVYTNSCSGGAVEVGAVATLESDGDEFQSVLLSGGMHAWPGLTAVNSHLGPVTIDDECDRVVLSGCRLGDVAYLEGPFGYGESIFQFISCAISGSVDLDCSGIAGMFVHNTVLGDFSCNADYVWFPRRFRSNIVTGETTFAASGLVVTHNDCVGGLTLGASGDSVFSNFSYPPLFCDMAAGDYTLEDCSPCVGAAHDGEDVGAFGIGCECSGSTIEESSWGRIKAGYR